MRGSTALVWSVVAATAAGALGACGAAADAPPSQTIPSGGSSATGGSGGDASISVGGIGGLDGGSDVIAPDAACAGFVQSATNTPLDLYIMLDKSSSMGGSTPGDKWNSSVAGLTAFVNDKASDGIRVALKFFPRDPDSVEACSQQAYATPDVSYDVLPKNAQPIISAINGTTANGLNTPTYPALGGAILASIAEKQNRPGDSTAVLLVTDGAPQGPAATCAGVNPEDTTEIAKLAANGLSYGVLTFVIALPGVPAGFADTVAKAGGGKAIAIGTTNVQQQFEDALAKIRGQALPCTFELPPQVPNQYATDKVNVILTSGGKDTVILQNPKCANGTGWHYDDPNNPKHIVLCASECDGLKKDYKASIDIRLGCPTQKIY
jgi:hypothetical protein